jgi:hypothetical protein
MRREDAFAADDEELACLMALDKETLVEEPLRP